MRCVVLQRTLNHRLQPAPKGGEIQMLKAFTVIAMAVVVLSLGACAHKEASSSSTTSTASKGYSK
jgi:hypothetical protein